MSQISWDASGKKIVGGHSADCDGQCGSLSCPSLALKWAEKIKQQDKCKHRFVCELCGKNRIDKLDRLAAAAANALVHPSGHGHAAALYRLASVLREISDG